MIKLPIYMDNNATTPLDPRVLEAMMPYLTTEFGNAASRSHSFGWKAEEAVDRAREQIAALIGGSEKELVFTSGATESINLALKGAAEFYKEKGNHIITVRTEHKATLDTAKRLERQGFEVNYLPTDKFGRIAAQQLRAVITEKTILVSVMLANTNTGTLQPVAELGEKLQDYLCSHLDHLEVNGHPTERLPGNLNVSFAYVEGEALMMAIKNVAVSLGSACTSASLEPSYVLRACGVSEDLAHTSIRFGIGRFNTEDEVDYVGKYVVEQVRRLREMSPLYEMANEGIDLSKIEWAAH